MYLVDYSKWKKILIILMIINLCFIIFSKINKVLGAEVSAFFTNSISLENKPPEFVIGSSQYGGTRTIKLPSFVYDYNNILVAMYVNQYSTSTKTGVVIFSNNKIMVNNGGTIYGEPNKDYYFKSLNLYYSAEGNLSGLTLNDFSKSNSNNPSWGGYLTSNSNYGYSAVFGRVYDYSNPDNVIVDNNPFRKPVFDNSQSEIQTLDFDYLFINPRDYGIDNKLYFKLLEVTNVVENQEDATQNVYYYNDLTFSFDKNSKYIKEFFDSGTYYYSLPYSALKLKKDKSYYFVLTNNNTQINQSVGELVVNDNIYDIILCDTQNLITTSDEILNSIINNNPSDNTNNNINNNLPRPGYNDNDNNINIPGMDVEIPDDVTTSSFNYIFNTIYNAITSEPRSIEFTIPFIHYNFTINPNFIEEWLDRYTVTVVGGYRNIILDLIHSFYYFIISYYILNDIRKNIEKVKSGDIMTHTDTNIKADML